MKLLMFIIFVISLSCAPTCKFWAKDDREMKYTKSKIEKVAKIIEIVNYGGVYEIIYKEE
jgi:hypothetical protein